MNDWADITDEQVEVDSPYTAVLAQSWTVRVPAAMQGAAGAPRLTLGALERLEVGDSIRHRRENFTAGTPSSDTAITSWTFVQSGSIRCQIDKTGASGNMQVVRVRNGTSTTQATGSGATLSVDVDVLPGDTVQLIGAFAASPVENYSVYLKVADDVSLFPSFSECLLEGNPTPND